MHRWIEMHRCWSMTNGNGKKLVIVGHHIRTVRWCIHSGAFKMARNKGRNWLKLTHLIHWYWPLFHDFVSEWVSEWASKQMKERSGQHKQSEQCRSSLLVSIACERASGLFHTLSAQCDDSKASSSVWGITRSVVILMKVMHFDN